MSQHRFVEDRTMKRFGVQLNNSAALTPKRELSIIEVGARAAYTGNTGQWEWNDLARRTWNWQKK
jgi:hypothetical protein